MKERLILQSQLKEIIPFSRTTVWRLEKDGKFPKRRQVSPGRVGWLLSEIEAFLAKLPESRTKLPKKSQSPPQVARPTPYRPA